jgi:hypothetical protein
VVTEGIDGGDERIAIDDAFMPRCGTAHCERIPGHEDLRRFCLRDKYPGKTGVFSRLEVCAAGS